MEIPNLISWIVFVPALTALALATAGVLVDGLAGRRIPSVVWRGIGLGSTLFTFGLSLALWQGYDPTSTDYQFVEYAPWIAPLGIHYFVGIDGISLVLVVLTTFLMPLVLLGSWTDIQESVPGFVFSMLCLQTGLLGAFASLNLFQFYVFWELLLIPMYFIIGVWGGPRRIHAAIKFFLFTMLGSLLMLVAMLVVYYLNFEQQGGAAQDAVLTMDFVRAPGVATPALIETAIPTEGVWWRTQGWLFAAFFLAFGIKVPLVPFHTWLPDAHVEAPTAGSVVLAGVLLKLGTYGFVRFALPLLPVAALDWAPFVYALALVGVLYGALVAMVQTDVKKLVAYSSVAHLGFVMLGMFAFNVEGLEGSVLQMVNHGLSTGALFLLVGMLYERRHTREISDFGGIAKPMPVFVACFGVVAMSSIGLPLLNGFVGEFLILLGTFRSSPAVGIAATFGVVLAAVYMLWMFRRMMFGDVENPENRGLIDLGLREKVVVAALLVPIFWIGIYPHTFLSRIRPSVLELLRVMEIRRVETAALSPSHRAGDAAALRLAGDDPEVRR